MRLVADDEVPLRGPEFLLHFRAAGELVQPRDAQVGFLKGIAGDGGGQAVVGKDLKAQVELLVELVLPLFGQIARADRELSAYLGIPEGANLRCALMVGYAKGESYPNQPPRPRANILWKE